MRTLHGIAVITGAQGGIGQSLVRAFATAGYAVLGVDVREPLATAVEGAHYLTVGISSGAGADEVAAACSGADRLVVCNNAARRDGFALAGEVSDQLWREVIAVNLTGPFLLTNRVIPLMLRHGGVIVNIASISGLRSGRGGAAYTAAKFGLVGLTLNVAASYGSSGIRCNAICPGPTRCPADATDRSPSERGDRMRRASASGPGRGDPADVAAAAVFPASPAAARINGVALPVDDGILAF
ncbi:MAG: SDR family oxidoreductase [Mycobacterium sp.]